MAIHSVAVFRLVLLFAFMQLAVASIRVDVCMLSFKFLKVVVWGGEGALASSLYWFDIAK